MKDTIICADKEDAKNVGDNIGWSHIENWKFLESGKVKLFLDCSLRELKNDEHV